MSPGNSVQPDAHAQADASAQAPRQKPRRVGVVTSDRMQKTITVVVERLEKHPLYKKYVRKRTVLKAHDEKGEAKKGALVEIEFSRPLSKTKRWNLVRVVRASEETAP